MIATVALPKLYYFLGKSIFAGCLFLNRDIKFTTADCHMAFMQH